MTVLLTGSMIWEGLIVTRGPFNMFQNILDLLLPPKVENYKNFWDKGLDKSLKRRQESNRLQRLHNKTRPYDSELGKQLSALYQKRKKQLHDAILLHIVHIRSFLTILKYLQDSIFKT
jgi:hypothetical protein